MNTIFKVKNRRFENWFFIRLTVSEYIVPHDGTSDHVMSRGAFLEKRCVTYQWEFQPVELCVILLISMLANILLLRVALSL